MSVKEFRPVCSIKKDANSRVVSEGPVNKNKQSLFAKRVSTVIERIMRRLVLTTFSKLSKRVGSVTYSEHPEMERK